LVRQVTAPPCRARRDVRPHTTATVRARARERQGHRSHHRTGRHGLSGTCGEERNNGGAQRCRPVAREERLKVQLGSMGSRPCCPLAVWGQTASLRGLILGADQVLKRVDSNPLQVEVGPRVWESARSTMQLKGHSGKIRTHYEGGIFGRSRGFLRIFAVGSVLGGPVRVGQENQWVVSMDAVYGGGVDRITHS
jgi:hypothetical protein